MLIELKTFLKKAQVKKLLCTKNESFYKLMLLNRDYVVNWHKLYSQMNSQKLEQCLKDLVDFSLSKLDESLKAIFMFGSGNQLRDFIPDLSDLDFLFILNKVDYATLQKIESIRTILSKKLDIKVDIKPFTIDEFINGLKGKDGFEFFTGWGLEMMKRGNQKCIYNSGEISLNFIVEPSRIKKDALTRAHYYITKLRKTLSSNRARLLRGEYKSLDNLDTLKIVVSSIKNVLTFCLAYQAIIVSDYNEVVAQSKISFGKIDEIETLFMAKKELKYDPEIIIKAYDKIEQIYKEVINE